MQNARADSRSRLFVVLFIRNYSLKRVIVKGGKPADTPSGEATPTQEASVGHLEDPVEEKPKRSPTDLENGVEDGTEEKGKI